MNGRKEAVRRVIDEVIDAGRMELVDTLDGDRIAELRGLADVTFRRRRLGLDG